MIKNIASIGTKLAHLHMGNLGQVVQALGGPRRPSAALDGTRVSPPVSLSDVQHYVGDMKSFPRVLELMKILKHGLSVNTKYSKHDLEKALQYGNHRSIEEHLPIVWEN